ncbi:hypothetical protein TWF694_001493 [Orbilia ellipsospora]|uniref:Peptidase A1 domain-containing protein n=1 Tax=Orbilia ellipsospora TaxID=2528407 RepID=A0AAV9XT80_9PEZI
MASLAKILICLLLSFLVTAANIAGAQEAFVQNSWNRTSKTLSLALTRRQKTLGALGKRSKTVQQDIGPENPLIYDLAISVGAPPADTEARISISQKLTLIYSDYDPTESQNVATIAEDGAFIYNSNSFSVLSDTFKLGGATVNSVVFGYSDQYQVPNVLGLGIGTLDTGQDYPTLLDGLVGEGYINTAAYSLWVSADDPVPYSGSTSASLLLGGIDSFKFKGHLNRLSLVPESDGFVVKLIGMSIIGANNTEVYASGNLTLNATISTDSEAIGFPYDMANEIARPFDAEAQPDGTWTATCLDSYAQNDPQPPSKLVFRFLGSNGAFSIELPADQFVSKETGYINGDTCLVQMIDTGLGSGKVFLGRAFLRRAYIVFDTVGKQVFMAQASYVTTNENIVEICSPGRNGIDKSGVPDIEGGSASTGPPCNEPPRTSTSASSIGKSGFETGGTSATASTSLRTGNPTSSGPRSTYPPGISQMHTTSRSAIVGISIGCAVLVSIICVAAALVLRRRRRQGRMYAVPGASTLPDGKLALKTHDRPIEMTGMNQIGGIVSPNVDKF